MNYSFLERWQQIQAAHESRLVIGLAPRHTQMPAPIAKYDDPFLPFGRAIINATADYACAYVFDLASYLALGAAGAIALERSIPLVPREMLTILHGPFWTADYVHAAFDGAFSADAVTLARGDLEIVNVYTKDSRHAVFVKAVTAMSSDAKGNIGFYDDNSFELGGSRLMWVTDPIIYASGKNDFEDAARKAAQQYQKESMESA